MLDKRGAGSFRFVRERAQRSVWMSCHHHPHIHLPRCTMLLPCCLILCYLITRMSEEFDIIPSFQRVPFRNRSIPSPHTWHRSSAIHFSRTSCARHSGLGSSLMRTKNQFRQSGKRSFRDRHRRAIQRRPRSMTHPDPMRRLPTRARQNM